VLIRSRLRRNPHRPTGAWRSQPHWPASADAGLAGQRAGSEPAVDCFGDGGVFGKREGLLDTNSDPTLDYYLVLCGPKATTLTSKGGTRPLRVTNVYLLDSAEIRTDQEARGTKSGVASSIRSALWTEAEIYPRAHPALKLDAEQRRALALFDWST
jgi:hypothetical protein